MTLPEEDGAGSGAADVARPRGRGRPKVVPDTVQRDIILAAAWRLLLDAGYGGTTMNDVVAACRVSKRTVYRLFPGKIDLFAAVVDLHRRSMLALPGEYDALPIDAALEAIFQIDIEEEADRARMALMTLFVVEGRQFPELGRIVREHGGDRSHELLVEWLERQRTLGRIEFGDAAIVAKMLMDISFGAPLLKGGDGPEWPGGNDRKAYLRGCIATIVNGLRPRGG